MQIFDRASLRQLDISMLIVRVIAGLTMVAHGYQKVFVYGVVGMTDTFTKMAVPVPTLTGPFISYLELIGGVMLVVGLLTRPIALLLAIDMFAAAALVHLKGGYYMPSGAEFVLLLMSLYIAIAIAGGGSMSVDASFAKSKNAPAR